MDLDDGCWIAYHSDWSGFALFHTEIEALRHAVEHTMSVAFVPWGSGDVPSHIKEL